MAYRGTLEGIGRIGPEIPTQGIFDLCWGQAKNQELGGQRREQKFATEVVGDNLIMLDKRSDGSGHGGEGMEGYHGDDIPPIGDPTENLPF